MVMPDGSTVGSRGGELVAVCVIGHGFSILSST